MMLAVVRSLANAAPLSDAPGVSAAHAADSMTVLAGAMSSRRQQQLEQLGDATRNESQSSRVGQRTP
jgi:hypothetical protein